MHDPTSNNYPSEDEQKISEIYSDLERFHIQEDAVRTEKNQNLADAIELLKKLYFILKIKGMAITMESGKLFRRIMMDLRAIHPDLLPDLPLQEMIRQEVIYRSFSTALIMTRDALALFKMVVERSQVDTADPELDAELLQHFAKIQERVEQTQELRQKVSQEHSGLEGEDKKTAKIMIESFVNEGLHLDSFLAWPGETFDEIMTRIETGSLQDAAEKMPPELVIHAGLLDKHGPTLKRILGADWRDEFELKEDDTPESTWTKTKSLLQLALALHQERQPQAVQPQPQPQPGD